MLVGSQCHAPATLPPGKTRHPFYRMLGGPRSGLDGCRKSRPPPGFDTLTAQPVASHYTDWAIPAHVMAWIIGVSIGSLHKTIKFSPYHPENIITYYLDELRNRDSSVGTAQLDSLLEQQISSSWKSLTRLSCPPIFLFSGSQGIKRPMREPDLTSNIEIKKE